MRKHSESHRSHRIGWLRAAVLGANDGIVSTASLLIGFAAASATEHTIVLSGIAGLVSGAMAMAAGEYVSVSSQADTESADLAREQYELENDHENELNELTHIYIGRGLSADLAKQVAIELTAHDAIGAHARDELGMSTVLQAKPIQAALASALTFAVGAALPLLIVLLVKKQLIFWIAATALLFLAVLGGVAAKAGGAPVLKGMGRVVLWGAIAMIATAVVGNIFGVAVG